MWCEVIWHKNLISLTITIRNLIVFFPGLKLQQLPFAKTHKWTHIHIAVHTQLPAFINFIYARLTIMITASPNTRLVDGRKKNVSLHFLFWLLPPLPLHNQLITIGLTSQIATHTRVYTRKQRAQKHYQQQCWHFGGKRRKSTVKMRLEFCWRSDVLVRRSQSVMALKINITLGFWLIEWVRQRDWQRQQSLAGWKEVFFFGLV